MQLVILVYTLTKKFPKSEEYGIASQMKRSAVSIPSNIAEGSRRGTTKDFKHFLVMSFGSGAELETQLELARRLLFGSQTDYDNINNLLDEIMKMLNKMINNLK